MQGKGAVSLVEHTAGRESAQLVAQAQGGEPWRLLKSWFVGIPS